MRFSGRVTADARLQQERELTQALTATRWVIAGPPVFMGYDPPFALPFLRRNEVAVRLASS
ncbi:hypothetical protein MMMDOFMJ_3494 [Methylobacterium gnaphalii]|uniref:SOUL heme-binding protein n=1 Tax=Methylobacterium gnaphalii TaxID=1010610 RepID=A0A512JRM1_9HYPH|nr:hypothetical protein MGN01_44340 [Methylobacterium gnaphalii]GJD70545.1 hypothetical protein MMMDOFMJ_3494 [Methylobacterium gnaphalii]GLS48454.1 hypothetical protein GCM10007885_12980 [Methylobacterium gnaphalii]